MGQRRRIAARNPADCPKRICVSFDMVTTQIPPHQDRAVPHCYSYFTKDAVWPLEVTRRSSAPPEHYLPELL
jgi:hypothetical protein